LAPGSGGVLALGAAEALGLRSWPRMKVTVVQGGASAEAEVSRVSAKGVIAALERRGHEPSVLELGPSLSQSLVELKPDVVFPLAHGALGEDGCLQGLLEILELPYVGSGVLASALGADKAQAKVFYRAQGLPVAREIRLAPGGEGSPQFWSDLGSRARSELGKEWMVKPNSGGSAVGATRLAGSFTLEDLERAVFEARRVSPEVLLESYHRGQELTCGVLETDRGPTALPPTLIESTHGDWYDFASKYSSGGSRHTCPAPLPTDTRRAIEQAALAAHRALGARDLSRSDFILGEEGFIVLETNTLPGMTQVSLFPEAAAVFGIPFDELIESLVRRAWARRPSKPDLVPRFPT
jgi:D-alanine-D-alanine ligase